MRFGLSEAKIASFDEITGTYKEIDPVHIIKETEISAGCVLDDKALRTLHRGVPYNEVSEALDAEYQEAMDAFRSSLYALMRLYQQDSVDMELPHNLALHTTAEELWNQMSEPYRERAERRIRKGSGFLCIHDRDSFEYAVETDFAVKEEQFKSEILDIMEKYDISEIHMELAGTFKQWNPTREQLEREYTEDRRALCHLRKQMGHKYD